MRGFAQLTGQTWKYRVWQVLTVAAGLVMIALFSLWQGNPLHLPEGLTTGVFFLVCIPWFIWYAAAIKCPKCGRSPTWYHMTHGRASSVERRLDSTVTCPMCGFNPLNIADQENASGPA